MIKVGGRGPIGPVMINRASRQAQGLIGWYPFHDVDFGAKNHAIFGDKGATGMRDGSFLGGAVRAEPMGWEGDAPCVTFQETSTNSVEIVQSSQDPAYVNYDTPFSIACWARLNQVGVDSGDRWTLWGAAADSSTRIAAAVREGNPYRMDFSMFNGSTYFFARRTFNSQNTHQWYHWVFTWDGGGDPSGDGQLYRNGRLNTDSTAAGTAFCTGGMFIAGASASAGTPWSIRDFRVYNFKLDADQVRAIYAPETRYDLYYQPCYRRSNFFLQSDVVFGGGPLVGPGGLVA